MKRLLLGMAVLLIAVPSSGATIAWWDFEDGVAGQPFTPEGTPSGSGGSADVISGYMMYGWDSYWGPSFTAETPTAEGLAMRNADLHQDGYATDAALRDWAPAEWTIETAVMLTGDAVSAQRWQTLIGRDSSAPGGGSGSALYFQKTWDNYFRIDFVTAGEQRYIATSTTQMQANRWYRMAATSDGDVLRLWINDSPNDGNAWVLAAETQMSTTLDNSMALADGNWTFGRGWWGGNYVDHINGYMDDIRFSDAALQPHQFVPEIVGYAYNPTPNNGREMYGQRIGDTVTAELGWNTGMDPEDSSQVWTEILVHYLSMSADQLASGDANLYLVDTIPAVGATAQAVVSGLNMDGWYLWQIEEGVDDGTGNPYPAGDPNNYAGPVWSFGTQLTPVISQQPANWLGDVGDTAEFSVIAVSLSPEAYQWYKAAGPERDETLDIPVTDLDAGNTTLTLSNVQLSSEGYYYCMVVNEGGPTRAGYSNMAQLGIRRQVGHWTLDQSDYVGGQYLDISGEGHHAAPNGEPTFITGQIDEGVRIVSTSAGATTQSWAGAGTWNPSEFSNQLSVSFWLKWSGVNGTWQSLLSKRSGDWDNANVLWQVCTNENGRDLWFQSTRSNVAVTNGLVPGQWQHIAATYNGTTATVYINGVSRGAGSFQFGDAVDSMLNIGGNSFNAVPREWMNGYIDDVRIYNYALGAAVIEAMYLDVAPPMEGCYELLPPRDTIIYQDANGTSGNIKVKHAAANFCFSGNDVGFNPIPSDVIWVSGANLGLSGISLTGTSRDTELLMQATDGTGSAPIGSAGISADGPVGKIMGPGMDLHGNVEIDGGLSELALGDVVGPLSIIIGPPAFPGQTVTLQFGHVDGVTILSQTPITSITADAWLNSDPIEDIIAASGSAPLSVFAASWLADDCFWDNDWCDKSDINRDGKVNMTDMLFISYSFRSD